MTKNDIVSQIYAQTRVRRADAAEAVEFLLDTIRAELVKGNEVKISGFGNFVIRESAERTAPNPRTGKLQLIKAKRSVAFRLSRSLRARMNAGRE